MGKRMLEMKFINPCNKHAGMDVKRQVTPSTPKALDCGLGGGLNGVLFISLL